ncbi:MAG: hypothetical protein ACPLX8_00585, partial [Nanopusillaceae archaeon]
STFTFSYNLPSAVIANSPSVSFICHYITSSKDCFEGLPDMYIPNPNKYTISSPSQVITIVCNIPSLKIDTSKCSNLANGFSIENKLEATLSNFQSNTRFSFLVVDIQTVSSANEKGLDIYSYLNLSRGAYDVNYYNTAGGLPYIKMARVGSQSGYPILLQRSSNSYDVLLLEFGPLNNVEKINKIVLTFQHGNDISLTYVNGQNCANTYSSGDQYSYQLNCNGDTCYISVNDNYLYNLKRNNQNFVVSIPICITPDNNFQKYSTVTVVSSINYDYKLYGSSNIVYYPSKAS